MDNCQISLEKNLKLVHEANLIRKAYAFRCK